MYSLIQISESSLLPIKRSFVGLKACRLDSHFSAQRVAKVCYFDDYGICLIHVPLPW